MFDTQQKHDNARQFWHAQFIVKIDTLRTVARKSEYLTVKTVTLRMRASPLRSGKQKITLNL